MTAKNKIIADLYQSKEFIDVIGKIDPEHLRDDLKQEIMLILLEKADDVIIELHESRKLKFYTVRIILNLVISVHSPFYKTFRFKKEDQLFDLDETGKVIREYETFSGDEFIRAYKSKPCYHEPVSVVPKDRFTERILAELREDKAKEGISLLYWYYRELLEAYQKHGNYRAVGKETNIPWESCYSGIRVAIQMVRDYVDKDILPPQYQKKTKDVI
jgi:hypothetical protein